MKRVVNSRENERAQRFEADVGCELRIHNNKKHQKVISLVH